MRSYLIVACLVLALTHDGLAAQADTAVAHRVLSKKCYNGIRANVSVGTPTGVDRAYGVPDHEGAFCYLSIEADGYPAPELGIHFAGPPNQSNQHDSGWYFFYNFGSSSFSYYLPEGGGHIAQRCGINLSIFEVEDNNELKLRVYGKSGDAEFGPTLLPIGWENDICKKRGRVLTTMIVESTDQDSPSHNAHWSDVELLHEVGPYLGPLSFAPFTEYDKGKPAESWEGDPDWSPATYASRYNDFIVAINVTWP